MVPQEAGVEAEGRDAGNVEVVKTLLALFALSVTLAPPFGRAEVTAVPAPGEGLRLEVAVEVSQSAVAVLVRGVGTGDELPPVALSDQGDGTWLGIVDLPEVENILMGFELIPAEGPATVSDLHTLVELGVDEVVFVDEADPEASASVETVSAADVADDDEEGVEWIWLALAAGAAGLALLLWWTVAPKKADDDSEDVLGEEFEPANVD
jgi:hypothetical protein